MKKYIVYIILFGSITSSCTKNFEELNSNLIKFEKASPEAIMGNVIKTTNDVMGTDNLTVWWDIAHFLTQQSNRYGVGGGTWAMYVTVLSDIQQLITTYENDPSYNNRVQAAKIWRSYVHSILVSQYGPIPITQANKPGVFDNIIFDDENNAYQIILEDLKDATAKIDPARDRFGYDVLYDGNMLYWKKFGNTLRLRIALQCTRNLGSIANQHISEVMADEANLINTEVETAKMRYENIIGNENPIFIRFKRQTFTAALPKMSDFIMLYMRSYDDPRMSRYYQAIPVDSRPSFVDTLKKVAADSMYVINYPVPYNGIPKAWKPSYWRSFLSNTDPIQQKQGVKAGGFSDAFSDLYLPERPYTVLSYAEAQFLKAEAKEMGLGGTQTAEQYYYSGIDANFSKWGISAVELANYKAKDGIKWNTEGKGYRNYLTNSNADIPVANINKIWVQSWLNHYPDGAFEVWNLQRRTRAMLFPPHTNASNSFLSGIPADVPHRASYPTSLSTLNNVGYQDALIKMGASTNDDYYPFILLKMEAPYSVTDWAPESAFYDLSYLQKFYGSTIEEIDAVNVPYTIISKYKEE